MASSAAPRASTRKRAAVKYYYESDDDTNNNDTDDQFDESLTDDESPPARKKRKTEEASSQQLLPQHKISPFTKLPPELKNQIYALTLTSPYPIYMVSRLRANRRTVVREKMTAETASRGGAQRSRFWRGWYPWRSRLTQSTSDAASTATGTSPTPMVPNILLLDKATYAQAQPMLYGGNTFAVQDTTALFTFLTNIGSQNLATITDLSLEAWGESKAHRAMNYPALSMLAGASNLEHFRIHCNIHYDGTKGAAKQLYRDGYHWFEVRGEAAITAVEMDGRHFRRLGYQGMDGREDMDGKIEELRKEIGRYLHGRR